MELDGSSIVVTAELPKLSFNVAIHVTEALLFQLGLLNSSGCNLHRFL